MGNIIDSIAKADHAMATMTANAERVRTVATRLLAEHAASLPELLAVQIEASAEKAYVGLQPYTAEDARLWADALGIEVTVSEEHTDHGDYLRACAGLVVDGVQVRVGSSEWTSPSELAARSAQAVAA